MANNSVLADKASVNETVGNHVGTTVDEELDAREGYVLDVTRYDDADLKTAADGRTVLIPQPSDSASDPLNWSMSKKLLVLITISTVSLLPDFQSATGVPAIELQALAWQRSPEVIEYILVGQCFAFGTGALLVAIFSNYFGRLPVLFIFQILAVATGVWLSLASSYHSYLAARVLSFFSIVGQAGGLMWIKDMFYFHEHPRMINIWSGGVIVSPYLGPFVESFNTWHADWHWGFWVLTIMAIVALIMVMLFGDESWYDRSVPIELQHPRKRRLLRLVGIEQWSCMRQSGATFKRAVSRPFVAILKLPVLLCVFYYFINFSWVIGVNATSSVWLTEFYYFNARDLGCFHFAGILGSIVGEVAGHWMHDAVGAWYMKRHGGRIEAEARLYLSYLASLIMATAVLILGFALQHTWHVMVVAVFYGVQVAGIMIATTSVNAYLLDSYPEGSGEVGAWIVTARTFGGGMATLIEIPWVTEAGAARALGIQASTIVAAALIIVFLQVFGKRLRKAQGKMVFLS